MTDGIGRIGSGSTSGIGGYIPGGNRRAPEENPETVNNNPTVERTDVKPEEVLSFLNNNSYFISSTKSAEAGAINGAAEGMEERVPDYMPLFELGFALISEEFGEEVALRLMNNDEFVDKLISMFE